jgi:SAM-dependent methyltransferase
MMATREPVPDDLVPPKELIHVGDDDFRAIGDLFLPLLVELGGLMPDDRVLDVGCGIGRMAVPLLSYLDEHGSYEGFDVVAPGIEWSKENISSRSLKFNFQWVDVYNAVYNPGGKLESSSFRFPYEDEAFDFVFLASVFTHMLPEGMANYFSEIARVLKDDGRSLITFFLLNPESRRLIEADNSSLDFRFEVGPHRTINAQNPEHAVCYDEEFVLSLYDKHGLDVEFPIHYGRWCDRSHFVTYQDIVVAHKRSDGS